MNPHWLRPLVSDTMPRRQMFLDVEAFTAKSTDRERQTFRCGSLLVVDYRHSNGHRPRENLHTYDKAAELADAVNDEARSGETIPIWAHHADYDLWVTGLIQRLTAMGWALTRYIAQDRIYALGMARGNKRLMFCNSYPLIKGSMEKVAQWLNVAYRPLPAPMARHLRWRKRSKQDVRLLRLAIEHIQRWWNDNELGPWRVTPAALGWAAYRRRFIEHKLLVTHDAPYNQLERSAYYTGRADMDRHGELPKDDYTELDITECYGSILTHAKLPRRPLCHGDFMSMETYRQVTRNHGVIAECEVTTDVDCVPCRSPNGVCYPVGTFMTTLCSPEIDLVLAHGGQVRFCHYAIYSMATITRKFGVWRETQLKAATDREDWPIAQLLKQWGRTTVGKFGQRRNYWQDVGGALHPNEIKIIRERSDGANYFTDYLNIGGRMLLRKSDANAETAMPSVAAWVCSLARVQLWEHMQQAGRDNVLYEDTDSLMVTPKGAGNLVAVIGNGPGKLRVKGEFQAANFKLPKCITVNGTPRMKGVAHPRKQLSATEWEVIESGGIMTQARISNREVWTRKRSSMNFSRPYDRKWCLANGRCVPLVMDVVDGMTYIVPWRLVKKRYGNLPLKDRTQSSRVARAP